MDKKSRLVEGVKAWVDDQYAAGRVTVITDAELEAVIDDVCRNEGIASPGENE